MRSSMAGLSRRYWVFRSMKSMEGPPVRCDSLHAELTPTDDNGTCSAGRQQLVDCPVCERVGGLVSRMPGMATDPMPLDHVSTGFPLEREPEIRILYGLAIRGLPIASLPLRQPLGDAVAQVLRIRVEPHAARAFQCREGFDSGRELHAVVGGVRFGAAQLSSSLSRDEQRTPAAGTGVATAGPVRIDLNFAHATFLGVGSTMPPTTARGRLHIGRIGVTQGTRLHARSRYAPASGGARTGPRRSSQFRPSLRSRRDQGGLNRYRRVLATSNPSRLSQSRRRPSPSSQIGRAHV